MTRTCRRCSVRFTRAAHHAECPACDVAPHRPGQHTWALYGRRRYPADRVRAALRYAVRAGHVLKPRACGDCGRTTPRRALHGHHEDYARPLAVRWLCARCHGAEHRQPAVAHSQRRAS